MDMQAAMLSSIAHTSSELLLKVSNAIAHARSNKVPIIYVTVGFRQGCPEVSESSCKSFAASKQRFAAMDMNEWLKIHPDVAPREGEVTVVKRRVSAFTGSDLEVILRAYNVRHLVLTGFSTSGVVLSTVCEATDKDYKLTVLSDGCADADLDLHNSLMTKFLPKRCDVMSVDEWAQLTK